MTKTEIEKGPLWTPQSKFEREHRYDGSDLSRGWFGPKEEFDKHRKKHYHTCGFAGWGENWEPVWNPYEGCRKEPWTHPILRLCDLCYSKRRKEQVRDAVRRHRHGVDVEIIKRHYEESKLERARTIDGLAKSVGLLKVHYLSRVCPKCRTMDRYLENVPKAGLVTCLNRKCGVTMGIGDWNAWNEVHHHLESLKKFYEQEKEEERAEIAESLEADKERRARQAAYKREWRARKKAVGP